MDWLVLINVSVGLVSLILGVFAIWLALHLYTKSKDTEKEIAISLEGITAQSDMLQKMTNCWMERFACHATEASGEIATDRKITMPDRHEGITHVVRISTGVGTGCEHCKHPVGLDHFEESINHYIEKHGYRLLHVGSEGSEDMDSATVHQTVAVLGR